MSLNLHATVRAAINTVNADIDASYQASTGYSTDAAGNRAPSYATPVTVQIQVQPLSKQDLQHIDFLNIEGVCRAVYMFGSAQGVNRPSQMGGDLLTFPQLPGGTPQVWLVTDVPETWGPGWCRVVVCLQEDVVT